MSASPLLHRLAESAEGLRRGGYLLVQDGEGFTDLPETLPLQTGASARVVRADSELALRHALWKAKPAAVIALIPESLALPADLLMGSERHRVHTLSGDEVLSALLGTRVTGIDDADLRALAVDHAAQIQARLHHKTTPTVIDRSLLERTLVEVVAELHDLRSSDGRLAELLARWIQTPPNWPAAIRRLAITTLAAHHGDPGRVLGWALQAPDTSFRDLLIRGALLGVEGDVPDSAWGTLLVLRSDKDSPLRAPAAARSVVSQLARDAALRLDHTARPLLDEADNLARRLLPVAQLRTSSLLPLAFAERAHAVATTLAAGGAVPRESFAQLRQHALARTAEHQLDLLEDMDRLVRYLSATPTAGESAAALALAYLRDDAHADRLVRRIERALASAPAHHAEAKSLLARVFAHRDALNLRYATALASNYVDTLYDAELTALQNVVRDSLTPRLAEKDVRGVFLLVLDGCSVPVFLDLLDQLAVPKHRIGLERGPAMRLRLDVGLSPLPTITSHARGALFLGAVPKDPFAAETKWREDGERQTDPARFKQNKALGALSRLLFLKGDLADGGAGLQAALRGDTAVVAAVFNAVDDRIGSHDTGAAWRLEVEDVTGLLPALQAALDSGRKVLLTADHGHTSFRGTALRVAAGSTPRFARLTAGEAAPDGFLEIDCADLSGEPGRTAYAWRSAIYRGQVQVGFHGGCSLEEMVVPLAWLTRDGVSVDRPAWWHPTSAPDATPAPAPLPPPPKPPQPATPLTAAPAAPTVTPALPPTAAAAAHHASLPFPKPQAPIERLPFVMRGDLDEEGQRAVAWVLAEGPIRTSILAARLERPAARVSGLLVKLNRLLAPHGARLVSETLKDSEQQWRYEGPEEAP